LAYRGRFPFVFTSSYVEYGLRLDTSKPSCLRKRLVLVSEGWLRYPEKEKLLDLGFILRHSSPTPVDKDALLGTLPSIVSDKSS
jgi:hypothetical protein